APGETDVVLVPVLAPSAAGSYRLEFSMVRESVLWFDQMAEFEHPTLALEVKNPPELDSRGFSLRQVEILRIQETGERAVYRRWLEKFATVGTAAHAAIAALNDVFLPPRLSILILADGCTPAEMQFSVAALRAQLYRHWEIRVVIGRDTDPSVRR